MSNPNAKAIPLNVDLMAHSDDLRTRSLEDRTEIFDPLRRKWVEMSPEEFVRQLLIQWLIRRDIGPGRISIEREMHRPQRRERYDLLVLDKEGNSWLLAECKSFRVDLNQSTFDQSSRYNRQLRVPYQLITNGRITYLSAINYEENTYSFLRTFPSGEQ